MLRAIGRVVFLLFRILRSGLRLVVPLLLVASLMFNAALFTVQGLYAVAAGALSSVGVATSAVRAAVSTRSRQAARRQIGRKTSQRVRRRVQRGAARSIGSAAGEAIPFIGVGVIAGGLALEVNDMCNTARDMAGLQAALAADDDPELAQQKAKNAFDRQEMIREELPGYSDLPTREVLWAAILESPAAAWNKAKKNVPDLSDFSESDASWLSWVTGLACKVRHCDRQEAFPE